MTRRLVLVLATFVLGLCATPARGEDRPQAPAPATEAGAAAPAAEAGAPAPAAEAGGTPAASGYAGEEMCAACHPEQAESFARTPHAWALGPARPEAERACEACHGPGAAHVEEGGGKGVGGLQNFASARPAPERSKVCLACHAGAEGMHDFRSSVHARFAVACTDCHRMHGGVGDRLLAKETPALCYGCHQTVRAEFALPEHHEVDEGVVSCLDCHRPHGGRDTVGLRGANDRACFRCHGDIEGPFVFEHEAVFVEGCAACHRPHGTVNRHLLRLQQVAQLCYQCHTVTPSDHVQPRFRDCTRCHVSIHGSNTDPHFLEQ